MRILFVIGTLDVGGAERQLVELATRLGPDFEPVVLCLSSARGPLARTLQDAGVPVETIGLPAVRSQRGLRRLIAAASVPAALVRLARAVRRHRPDVIHGFLFHGYILAAIAGRLAGVPAVVASRRSLSHFKRDRPMLQKVERRVNNRTDLIIANSEAVRQDVLHTEGVAADKVIVIYNGLDAGRYAGQRNAQFRRELVGDAGPVAVVVANFIAYKGHRFFLDAWARVVKEHSQAVALFAGDGVERTACEALARDLGISERVRFLGTRTDVGALLNAADLLVHPSLEEGFCNAIVEAMAAGLPVVATSVGGNPEAIVVGETGYLVPPRDASALAGAILDVWRRPDAGRSMGAAGAARARARFTTAKMVASYAAVYADLLARKKGSADVRNRGAR